jgi:hypothetical protein
VNRPSVPLQTVARAQMDPAPLAQLAAYWARLNNGMQRGSQILMQPTPPFSKPSEIQLAGPALPVDARWMDSLGTGVDVIGPFTTGRMSLPRPTLTPASWPRGTMCCMQPPS